MKVIRVLNASEIECRIGTINEKGLSLLLYKDARADMKILDEVFSVTGWQRKHEVINGNLYCTVSIWDSDKKQWIEKMDVGTESNTEKAKGQASDSFKRACVSLGIGRELYTAPFIWIPASKFNLQRKGEKYITYDKFKVKSIDYNENREIISLTILNQEGVVVYSVGNQEKVSQDCGKTMTPSKNDKEKIIYRELERTGVALDSVLDRYGISSISDMTDVEFGKAISGLKKTKSLIA